MPCTARLIARAVLTALQGRTPAALMLLRTAKASAKPLPF